MHCFAADTDGIDGSEDNAGAFADYATQDKLRAHAIDAKEYLADNNSFTAFAAIDQLRPLQKGSFRPQRCWQMLIYRS